ncbi:MAG TPA: glycolate oxidase subunit GlcE [bacterium]
MSATPSPDPLRPASLEEVQAHVQEAAASGRPLELLGAGSKRGYGRPVQGAQAMSLGALSGIVDYQPHELILVARPGTPLAQVEATLAEAGQALAFEPPHWSAAATLGGVIACNLSGPRRFKAGAARDHLLGFQAVTGTGEAVRGGGRVVKNVTGYDLPKLLCGSFGTLAVFTELVLKVLPHAEAERTVLLRGLTDGEAVERLGAVSRSVHEPSGLAHLPAGARVPGVAAAVAEGAALTAVRLEGPEPSVRHRSGQVGPGAAGVLETADSRAFWTALREGEPLALAEDERRWRFSVAPMAGARLGSRLGELGGVRLWYDWGGALVWAAVPAPHKPALLHRLAREHGGHAQLVAQGARCPHEEPAFSPLSPPQQRLHANLKRSFDPQRVLNPGRMYAEL